MFNSLKDKLKGALSKFSREVEEEADVEEVTEEVEEKVEEEVPREEEKPARKKFEEKKEEKEESPRKEEKPEEKEAPEEKGIIKKITRKVTHVELSDEKFEDLFWDLEVALMENNVALEVVEKIKQDMKERLTGEKVGRGGVEDIIIDSLKESIEDLFRVDRENLVESVKKAEKPFVIAMVGVNGSGKTTTMAKLAKKFMDEGLSVVFAAGDTFRAASMEQLGEHADNLGVKMIQHDYKSDPAAVAYDAVQHARSKGIDVVLIDTAGRLHSNKNLMQELKKLIKVNEPDMKIFVGESTTGNDCVEQAKQFDEAVGVDAIILSKADVDDKGGAAISVSYVTGKPILYIGTGQEYDDLEDFSPDVVMDGLF